MSDIENAIRKKLSQVDIHDVAARRQVYEAVWNAHEQYLISNENMNDEDRVRRRHNLTAVIKHIEQSFHKSAQQTSNEVQSQTAHPSRNVNNDTPNAIRPDDQRILHKAEKKSQRRSLLFFFFGIIFLLILCAIGWFFINGSFNKIVSFGTINNVENSSSIKSQTNVNSFPSVPSSTTQNKAELKNTGQPSIVLKQSQRPPQEETRPLRQDILNDDKKRSEDGWVRVFTPNDVVGLSVTGGAKAQIINSDGDSYVRISSQAINDAAVINIGSGALDPLRGHMITINILARSNTNTSSQLIVTCDFGGKVECGRVRFEVPATRDDLLLNVMLPAKSSGPGKIYLTSNYSQKDQSIDIYRVFIRKND